MARKRLRTLPFARSGSRALDAAEDVRKRPVALGQRLLHHHLQVDAGKPVALSWRRQEVEGRKPETLQSLLQLLGGDAEVHRRGQKHVTGDAADRLQVEDALCHRRRLREMRAA
jgi:hypothetical protein